MGKQYLSVQHNCWQSTMSRKNCFSYWTVLNHFFLTVFFKSDSDAKGWSYLGAGTSDTSSSIVSAVCSLSLSNFSLKMWFQPEFSNFCFGLVLRSFFFSTILLLLSSLSSSSPSSSGLIDPNSKNRIFLAEKKCSK